MPDAASILHADLDAFYASVEQRDEPTLLGRPVIVGGGVVLSASYEARRKGVRTAMGGERARRLCPDAVVVSPRFEAYVVASRAVFEIFRDTAPVVEALSIDEAFLDVSGLERISSDPLAIASRLRATVRHRVGLPITVGIARTKFLAKVASGAGKPDGLLVVEPDCELEFLHPLAVGALWGVGPATERRLAALGARTVGDVAALGEEHLAEALGSLGRRLHALSHGRDARRVEPRRARRSVGAQRALGRGAHASPEVAAALLGLVDRVARRMRGKGLACRTVVLRVRFGDYARITRSRTVQDPTDSTRVLAGVASALLSAARPLIDARGITLVGVSLTNLAAGGARQSGLARGVVAQAALPGERDRRLDAALDGVRERFGSAAVMRGASVGRGREIEVPLLD